MVFLVLVHVGVVLGSRDVVSDSRSEEPESGRSIVAVSKFVEPVPETGKSKVLELLAMLIGVDDNANLSPAVVEDRIDFSREVVCIMPDGEAVCDRLLLLRIVAGPFEITDGIDNSILPLLELRVPMSLRVCVQNVVFFVR